MAKPLTYAWKGRPIADPEHSDHLEVLAGLNQFHRNMLPHQAEDAAHDDYKKDQLVEAAAHHLQGLKAALGAGDHDSASKHGMMYGLALKALGHPIVGETPPEIASKAKHLENSPYKFKAHKADQFVLPDKEKSE